MIGAAIASEGAPAGIVCPACGGENAADSVFCAGCHKALGEFRYATEEVLAASGWHERVAERVAGFVGRPHFVLAHLVWFVIWVAANSGVVMAVRRFDGYPYSLLGILLSMEAIFITGFLLITQNRQNAYADRRAEMDYEIGVRSYRRLEQIQLAQHRILDRLDALESAAALLPERQQRPRMETNS